MISAHDQRALTHYFGVGATRLERSTFGAQIDHAQTVYRDSSGKVVPRAPSWNWDRNRDVVQGQTPRVDALGPCMVVRETRNEASHEIDETSLETSGWVSRRLSACERLSPGSKALLEVLYGDQGERWERQKEGRVWALTPHTGPGRAGLRRISEERAARGQPPSSFSPTEQLAEEARAQKTNPTDRRAVWLESLGDATDALLLRVEQTWGASG